MLGKFVVTAVLACQLVHAAGMEPGKRRQRLWWASVAAFCAASIVDVHSSWGKPEINPLLRGPNGLFGARAVPIKFGIVGASTAVQWLILRKHPALAKTLAGTNIGGAAVTAGLAARNY